MEWLFIGFIILLVLIHLALPYVAAILIAAAVCYIFLGGFVARHFKHRHRRTKRQAQLLKRHRRR